MNVHWNDYDRKPDITEYQTADMFACHKSVISQFTPYYWVCSKRKTTGPTSRPRTANPTEVPKFIPSF